MDEALDDAFFRYRDSDIHDAVIKQFSARPKEYSVSQFTEFILQRRL